MDYIETQDDKRMILCCECGIQIEPNVTNQCLSCVRSHNDIAAGIPKQGSLYMCRGCERYLDPPNRWLTASLESRELLAICLKKLKAPLSKVRLINAQFIFTEAHSKRIKVMLKVQKEIQTHTVLEQEFVVEFVVNHQMCEDCHRVEAKDYWRSLVQVRQKTDHKRTFYYLEQLMLKHGAHESTLGIKPVGGGLDLFYSTDQHARKMVDFLTSIVPCQTITSKRLISHDIHSNTYNNKITHSVEIVPICKDSVVCLPSQVAHQLGGISQLAVVQRVTSHIQLIDPQTAQLADVTNSMYWRRPFRAIATSKQLVEFIVIDVNEADVRSFKGQGRVSQKHVVGEVWVQRAADLGGDKQLFCRSHLGHLLSYGDSVMGIDVSNSNVNDENLDKLSKDRVPDVILVKKIYADKATRNRRRRFKLRHIGIDDDATSQNNDYTDFLEDVEEDPQYRQDINMYKDEKKLAAQSSAQSEAGDLPTVGLDEMLEDLIIGSDPTGCEGAEMVE